MKKRKNLVLIMAFLVIATCIGVLGIFMVDSNGAEQDIQSVQIQTSYVDIQFPGGLVNDLKHIETVEEGVTVEVFSMILEAREIELFRIYFGESQRGTVVGYLHVGSDFVPVVVSVSDIDMNAFGDEETRVQYYSMMDAINTVLYSIYQDERFSDDKPSDLGENIAQTTFWTFRLPENMVCEESEVNGEYKLIFSAYYSDEYYPLYTVHIGNETHGSFIGNYLKDAETKLISLEISDVVRQENLPEGVENSIYELMDTINDVMEIITGDEHFSEHEAE